MKRKPIEEQVIVITGGSSGIGLVTGKMAAKRGARVVLAARDEQSLQRAVEEIRAEGGQAAYAVADVADMDQVQGIADTAVREFGGIDTWINDAGTSIYGEILRVPLDDARRLFDTNYWGVVHGSMVAARQMQDRGGVLINVGSVLSDRAIALQGHYSATKHAVKAFTDALRMELERAGRPIAVTLIKPSAIATPYPQHATNYLGDAEPNLPPPVYAPETVARTMLRCAEKPVREIAVGAGGRMIGVMGAAMPRVADKLMETAFWEQQKWYPEDDPTPSRSNLHRPVPGSGRERGETPRMVLEHSAYTTARLHPLATLLGAAALGIGAYLTTRLTAPPQHRRPTAYRSQSLYRSQSEPRRQSTYTPSAPRTGVRENQLPLSEKTEVEEVW